MYANHISKGALFAFVVLALIAGGVYMYDRSLFAPVASAGTAPVAPLAAYP